MGWIKVSGEIFYDLFHKLESFSNENINRIDPSKLSSFKLEVINDIAVQSIGEITDRLVKALELTPDKEVDTKKAINLSIERMHRAWDYIETLPENTNRQEIILALLTEFMRPTQEEKEFAIELQNRFYMDSITTVFHEVREFFKQAIQQV